MLPEADVAASIEQRLVSACHQGRQAGIVGNDGFDRLTEANRDHGVAPHEGRLCPVERCIDADRRDEVVLATKIFPFLPLAPIVEIT